MICKISYFAPKYLFFEVESINLVVLFVHIFFSFLIMKCEGSLHSVLCNNSYPNFHPVAEYCYSVKVIFYDHVKQLNYS